MSPTIHYRRVVASVEAFAKDSLRIDLLAVFHLHRSSDGIVLSPPRLFLLLFHLPFREYIRIKSQSTMGDLKDQMAKKLQAAARGYITRK